MAAHARVRAPRLEGRGGWINTGGSAPDLSGKIVLLDFWTFCCANCLHVLDELRELEAEFADVLVTVGVHSPKFAHEADHDALIAACERYGVHHPVLDDPDLATWKAFAVRAWPTLTVIDPAGYVAAQMSGEGHVHGLRALLHELVAQFDAKGALRRGDSPYVAPEPEPTELRFPGKLIALPGGGYLVSDTSHHSIVELAADAETVLRRFGSGERGLLDGGADKAEFNEPQGLLLLDEGTVLVADTVNHALRELDLATGDVRTAADTRERAQASPWDLAWDGERVVVAMAGIHQLWSYHPANGTLEPWAGTTNEGLVDGPVAEAWFSQPSGLARDERGRFWIADSESSALRYIDRADGAAVVKTVVGQGLFDFGLRDGAAEQALLQHPLGVTALPDGSIAVSDTYNGAVRRYNPADGQVTTLITGLKEPSDALVTAEGDLLVVESAAHRLTRVRLPEEALSVEATAYRTQRPATEVGPGELELEVVFEPPPGEKMDDRYGPSTYVKISSTPAQLLLDGPVAGVETAHTLRLNPEITEGVLHVAAKAASCDDGEFPACHLHQQDWGIPLRIVAGGPGRLPLILRG
ncbi:redoxin domain-containing protein [Actinospica durhamensis]|uniref:Redoxin domain-containing protein n=1 Tax=Actinospica durhamensis TaxID=1508375 RepID=A0A941EHM0_9ACTN|nr:NHL domain-containing thioredoxin family protein [Actinospica durhamensis]MBR7831632.1 redoxin domain-containing protein [Actinospica durhamensis]